MYLYAGQGVQGNKQIQSRGLWGLLFSPSSGFSPGPGRCVVWCGSSQQPVSQWSLAL